MAGENAVPMSLGNTYEPGTQLLDAPEPWGTLRYVFAPECEDIELVDKEITIGRAAKCTIQLRHTGISGTHCIIGPDSSGRVFISDRSSNGTFMDGRRLPKRDLVPLVNGSIISLLRAKNAKNRTDGWEPMCWELRIGESSASGLASIARTPTRVETKRKAWKIEQEYNVMKHLGQGSFGKVDLVKHIASGMLFACKAIDTEKLLWGPVQEREHNKLTLQREVEILEKVKHDHVVRLHRVVPAGRMLYLFLEYVDGGDLFDLLKANGALQESDARVLFAQIVQAVQFLHKSDVVHRDLKPENVLVTKRGVIKVTDFGLSRVMPANGFVSTVCGTPEYCAPEVLHVATGVADGYSHAVDIWSMGVILYTMLCGRLPFHPPQSGRRGTRQRNAEMFQRIRAGTFNKEGKWNMLSMEAKDLITGMLVVSPAKRAGVEDIMGHRWLEMK